MNFEKGEIVRYASDTLECLMKIIDITEDDNNNFYHVEILTGRRKGEKGYSTGEYFLSNMNRNGANDEVDSDQLLAF